MQLLCAVLTHEFAVLLQRLPGELSDIAVLKLRLNRHSLFDPIDVPFGYLLRNVLLLILVNMLGWLLARAERL